MAKFNYNAKNAKGEFFSGQIEASSEKEVALELRGKKLWPTKIEKVEQEKKRKKSKPLLGLFGKVSLKSKMIFCRHLAVMSAAGLSLSRSLSILEEQEKDKTFRKVIGSIATEVKKGSSFADTLEQFPNVFDPIFSSMVRTGELSGNLEEILNLLAKQLEKDHKLISRVKGAMIYPAIIIGVMCIVGILMMIFVVPKITTIFKDFGADLPWITRVIIDSSQFASSHSWLILVSLLLLIFGTKFFYGTKPGQIFFHKLFIMLPIFGPMIVKINSARFSRILSSLLDSGVSLVESLDIVSSTLGNYYYKKAIKKASEEIQKGIQLSEVLSGYKIFPHLVVQMIEVGEETGSTPDILTKLASFYEEEVDQTTKNLSSVIEPVLMVIIGTVVGLFAVAIIQPIYSVMEML